MISLADHLLDALSAGLTLWVLLAGALICLLLDALWPRKMTLLVYSVAILSLLLSLYICFLQWLNLATWPQQHWLVMNFKTLFFIALIVMTGLLTLFNALGYLSLHQTLASEFCAQLLFAIVGMIFLFASNHLLINFIGLEIMSLSLCMQVGSHKHFYKSREAAIKYFILGSVASAVLLFGIALLYGAFGTIELNLIAIKPTAPELAYLKKIAQTMLLFGLLFKIGIVPLHFWVPDVYEGAPAPVTGFMATGVKIAAFAFALNVFDHLDLFCQPQVTQLLTGLAMASLVLGNLLALVQDSLKRMLAYSSIAHAGFILLGLVAGVTESGWSRQDSFVVLFYLAGYLIMTLGAFAIVSLFVSKRAEADQLTHLRGLGQQHPILAGTFTLFMLSLIGLPGTVGFIGKYNVIALAVRNGHLALAIIAVLATMLSVYYYLKPTVYMYLSKDTPKLSPVNEIPLTTCIAITLCAFSVIYFGIQPDAIIRLAKLAVMP